MLNDKHIENFAKSIVDDMNSEDKDCFLSAPESWEGVCDLPALTTENGVDVYVETDGEWSMLKEKMERLISK